MKLFILLLLTVFLIKVNVGQSHRRTNPYYISAMRLKDRQWHLAIDTLKEPTNNTGYYVSVSYFNRYDTVQCHYIAQGSCKLKRGFKKFYVSNGYYTDDSTTLGMFYDRRMNRLYNVYKYYFK